MAKIQVAHLAISLYLYFIKLEKQESRNQIRPTILRLNHFYNRSVFTHEHVVFMLSLAIHQVNKL